MYPKLLSVKWGRFNDQAETATCQTILAKNLECTRLVVCNPNCCPSANCPFTRPQKGSAEQASTHRLQS